MPKRDAHLAGAKVVKAVVHVSLPCATTGCKRRATSLGLARVLKDGRIGEVLYAPEGIPCKSCVADKIAKEKAEAKKRRQQLKWRGKTIKPFNATEVKWTMRRSSKPIRLPKRLVRLSGTVSGIFRKGAPA